MDAIFNAIGQAVTQGPVLAFFVLMLALILGPRLAERIKLPAMVGLVLAGMLVGPHGFRILATKEIALTAWGNFGLLYLMFAAGLELDLKLFVRMKKAAITFAVLSFSIPFLLGVASARLLSFAWAGAILMGSNWGSHTLVTYPLLRKAGLARNRAVGTVVGATAVTDTTALLVLCGVAASATSGKAGGGVGVGTQIGMIAVGLALLAGWSLFVLPRLARWFFARVGTDASYRFVFGMTAFLSGAVLAQAAGIDGIVGAFFAGLGLNRAIPEESPLMERVQFFGAGLFIPIFLVSVGILLEPKVLIDPKTLLVAAVFTVAVLGGKALAAVLAGRRFGFTWPEVGVMSGLSGSQAAATLATTLVGAKLGIFDKQTINAVLVVILLSLVITPAVVSYFAKKVTREEGASASLGTAVLVPVWGEASRPLLGVAGQLASADGGLVLAASFATEDASEGELASQRGLKDQAEEWLAKEGLESRTIFRVSRSVPAGLQQAIRSEKATLLVAQWRSESRDRIETDSEAFKMLSRSPIPVLVGSGPLEHFERLVVLARREDLVRPGRLDLELAVEAACRIARHRPVVLVTTSVASASGLFVAKKPHRDQLETLDPLAWITENGRDTDLLLLAGIDAAHEALDRVPHFADRRFLIAIAAHGAAPIPRPARSTGLVGGRSLTEAGA
jgi:Kef-type K+ transport system membrane component KefB